MHSLATSFAGLFDHTDPDVPEVKAVEIPLIQRDYAQGRREQAVTVIRDTFLDVLHSAATGGDPVGLDFVYGEVDEEGILAPLDGQQRLTTLFLLHWYVAARTNRINDHHRWTRFTYATRPGARLFCEQLVQCALPTDMTTPSDWITDRPWHLHLWQHDPTVQSMLVMLDALHNRFAEDDLDAVWARLVDDTSPAISFHLLPIEDMGSAEDLYIKMNSRGKPLTEFENFKARFEKLLEASPRAQEFAQKIDGVWTDVMWPLHGDNIVDDEFINYFRYLIELCEWRQQDVDARRLPLLQRAQRAFASAGPGPADSLDFLFDAFDTWVGVDTESFFGELLTASRAPDTPADRVVLFGAEGANQPNLFRSCCHGFDSQRFGNPSKLLLYAVLLHRIHNTEDFPVRLRSVRNLIAASEDEIRPDRLPTLVEDVQRIVVDGYLEGIEAFNNAQKQDEIDKRAFLQQHPDLRSSVAELEDHEVLRGSLAGFELDAELFAHRATAFEAVLASTARLPRVTGALLAVGDYHRSIAGTYRFGSSSQLGPWRTLLTGSGRPALEHTRTSLGKFLDLVAESDKPIAERLDEIRSCWLDEVTEQAQFDWRYYLVKYVAMREGKSGIYASSGTGLGFSLCMLDRYRLSSYYRDPFLLAVAREAKAQSQVIGSVDGGPDGPWFRGYASLPRWMRLPSGAQIRCITQGFELHPPPGDEYKKAFDEFRLGRGLESNEFDEYLVAVPGIVSDGARLDTSDRVQIGAKLLEELLAAGL